MTKEELKAKLAEHNFDQYNDFLDLVDEVQAMDPAEKYSLLLEEYTESISQS